MASRVNLKEVAASAAILVITGSMLIPLLRAATPAGDAAPRMNKIAMGIGAYLEDNDWVFPRGSGYEGWAPTSGGWIYDLKPYVPGWKATFQSPNDPRIQTSWPDWMAGLGAFNTSFASNGLLKFDPDGYALHGLMGWDQSVANPGGWMARGVTAMSSVTNPGDTISFAEAYNGYPLFLTSDVLSGVDWWDTTTGFGGLQPDPTRTGLPYEINGTIQSMDNRNGGVNGALRNGKSLFAYADGHVARRVPLATNPNPSDPSKNRWDAYRTLP